MSAERAALTHSWQVGAFTATLTVQHLHPGRAAAAIVEWAPHLPTALTPAELNDYRKGRDIALQALGLPALVVDL